ncbi:glycoside hydrolase family 127 protein [Cohnella sp. AR92]|uniref:glycoside hydrolase family 127 protein n=1 Tax=Cohnella sp. AR92 TaxID=648716 RepID=UPI000F8E08DB|nr:beta-L-arabinofuranosidase domain-containing protein [Cohnella sp. AR92]RUS43825.1 glycoside hydrolase family 127 protein [Cohnella sp. AR92]
MNVRLIDQFWQPKVRRTVQETIPYQWKALNDEIEGAEPSHAVENFRISAGEQTGTFYGMVFQDSDVAKWVEAAAHSLRHDPNPRLEAVVDAVVDLMGRAQKPDGYLNTYYSVAAPDRRWKDFSFGHELYCAGHLIEAAVAYYESTGKRKFLDVMCRYADYIDRIMGPQSGQIQAYCGHEEIELALVKLHRATKEQRYLDLSRHFIEERGKQPSFLKEDAGFGGPSKDRWFDLDYHQAHAPVREQETAEGHSVRAMYLYAAMADLALAYADETLTEALRKLWDHVTTKRMYITGGIGSQGHAERFTVDYDLPNDTAYTETCASIGLVMWASRMLRLEQDGRYGDVMERVLYNGVLSGISLDGTRYFYVNPLEVHPAVAHYRYDMQHVKTERVPWFGCACCPPNIARLLTSLDTYFFTQNGTEIAMHLYASNESAFHVQGRELNLRTETRYPWNGEIRIRLRTADPIDCALSFRIPSWCRNPSMTVNGEALPLEAIVRNGYARISRKWSDGDDIKLDLPMVVERIESNPKVHENAGKIALQYGPLVYCLEEEDNGPELTDIRLPADSELSAAYREDVLGGIVVLSGEGLRSEPDWEGELYRPVMRKRTSVPISAVPYAYWGNRTPGEMAVWIREKE